MIKMAAKTMVWLALVAAYSAEPLSSMPHEPVQMSKPSKFGLLRQTNLPNSIRYVRMFSACQGQAGKTNICRGHAGITRTTSLPLL